MNDGNRDFPEDSIEKINNQFYIHRNGHNRIAIYRYYANDANNGLTFFQPEHNVSEYIGDEADEAVNIGQINNDGTNTPERTLSMIEPISLDPSGFFPISFETVEEADKYLLDKKYMKSNSPYVYYDPTVGRGGTGGSFRTKKRNTRITRKKQITRRRIRGGRRGVKTGKRKKLRKRARTITSTKKRCNRSCKTSPTK